MEKPATCQTAASAFFGICAFIALGSTSGKSSAVEKRATRTESCVPEEPEVRAGLACSVGSSVAPMLAPDPPAATAAASKETVGIAVNTSGLMEVTVDGALMRSRLAQASRAPAAMVVQPSRMAISVAPAGTRRSVVPSASYRSPSQEERCALPASTEIESTPAQCEKADASTSSAFELMRTAPCLPPGMSRRLDREAS